MNSFIEQLTCLDTKVFFWINHAHNPFTDVIFWILSRGWSWAVLLAGIFTLITLRKYPRTWFLILIGTIFCFLFGDRISVMLFKNVFLRLRPCHALDGVRLLDGYCGGQYGFISSHAANAFALALFFSLTYKNIKYFPASMIIWALLVSYSRPYLGVHYPGDVICGGITGASIGCLVYFIIHKFKGFIEKKYHIKFQ